MEKRRQEDNGYRKYLPSTNILAILIIIGLAASFISNLKMIPGLSKKIEKTIVRITILETKYIVDIANIKDNMKEIKNILKEKQNVK